MWVLSLVAVSTAAGLVLVLPLLGVVVVRGWWWESGGGGDGHVWRAVGS